MKIKMYRDTWVEVDLGAIEHNVQQMKRKLSSHSHVMAVVKADGYGHGSVQVAKKALESGATYIAVALLEEALVLREAGIEAPILVLNWIPPAAAVVAAENNITVTFFQEQWLRQVSEYHFKNKLMVHMKWDTGMGRVGIRTESELRGLVYELNKNHHIHLTGLYTHFATADETDVAYYEQQNRRFEKLLHIFEQLWKEPVDIHTGNSAASIRFPKQMYQYVRFGISMYGLYPSLEVKREKGIDLQPALSLHSRLVHVKEIAEGEAVGYGAEFKTTKSEWIGTIPIGYGDGWPRKLQGADVLIEGKRFPVVGRICMDQTMIQLDQAYPIGTKVTLIGRQEDDFIEADEIAHRLDTINYEVVCMINNRVPRIYKKG